MTPEKVCECITCSTARHKEKADSLGLRGFPVTSIRYACEICGNKRCPHHTDHRLECTASNEPGQKGSIWE